MTQKQYFILKHMALGSLFLLSPLNAQNQDLHSQAYLSSLESKIEEMRYQLQDQQRNNVRIEESLAQIKQFKNEIQALKDKIQNSTKEELLTLAQRINTLDQQKNELLKSQEEILASIDAKATKTDVDHSFYEITSQIAQIKQSLELRPSTLQVDSIELALARAEKDVKHLKLDYQEIAQQKIKLEEIENSFKSLGSQIAEANQHLEKVYVAWVAQADKVQNIEQQQLELSKKVVPPIQDTGWKAYIEFLYWKNVEPNLNYAVHETLPTLAGGGSLDNRAVSILGSIKSVDYAWDPGFRIGAGYRWGVDSWDLYVEYTRFRNKGSDSHSKSVVEPTSYDYLKGMFVELFTSNISHVESKATLTYNVWDVTAQRPFYETSSIAMRFLMGLRGALIEQNWKTHYKQVSTINPYETVKNKWSFGGGGPRAGINFEWLWNYGFGLHFQASGGLIWGHFDNKQTILKADTTLPPNSSYRIGKINPKNGKIIPTVEMVAGIQWEKHWSNWGLHLFADWQFNHWADLNETYYFPQSYYNQEKVGSWLKESVSLQGLTLGARMEF